MKILYAGFKGKTNSAKILLDKMNVTPSDKLYLTNSFSTSERELEKKLEEKSYDLVVGIGQLKLDVDTIRIERFGIGAEKLETGYDYVQLKRNLEAAGYIVEESVRTNYLCNHIYYYGLKYIKDKKMKTKMIFIHLPKVKNINSIEKLGEVLLEL